MKVRTRVAPSPTGDPHVGTAYIALFNYCLAKKHGGEFILRIEDTDQVRSTRESEETILKALNWCGISWDEGPEVGGPYGPYRQSERSKIYEEHAQKLLESGHAFRCFCSHERLGEMRAAQRESGEFQGYDGHCISLSDKDSEQRAQEEPFVVRMKVPREGTCVIHDHFRGEIEFEWASVDMQVLVKSDGLPTYHLANVVDDHLMEITHVLRGEEWITSAPKHQLLYQYFGWEMPELCHLPLLRNPDKSKLSKRKNPTSILYYERMGYLPEALMNYLGMMAWTMPGDEEKFTLSEMVEAFSLDRISLGSPVFDVPKLDWLNGRYIREDHTADELFDRLVSWKANRDYIVPILEVAQKRTERLSDLAPMTGFFFSGALDYDTETLVGKAAPEDVQKVLQFGLWELEALRTWESEAITEALRDLAERMDMKLRDFLKPFFVALSGHTVSTPLFDSMRILGPDMTRARVRAAVGLLGVLGKKKLKKLQKEYDALNR